MPEQNDERKETPEDIEKQIQWWLSDEFEAHIDKCFGEGKRKAIEERDAWLAANATSDSAKPATERSAELNAEIERISAPEFQDDITWLFGEAKDRAIEERDRRLSQQQSQSQQ